MILALVFVCYVSDEAVSFSNSIPMRNVAYCKHFLQDIFCWFIIKKVYDSAFENALIKFLGDITLWITMLNKIFFLNYLL